MRDFCRRSTRAWRYARADGKVSRSQAVKIRKLANTLVAHRIPWTEDFAVVIVTETAGPPSL